MLARNSLFLVNQPTLIQRICLETLPIFQLGLLIVGSAECLNCQQLFSTQSLPMSSHKSRVKCMDSLFTIVIL